MRHFQVLLGLSLALLLSCSGKDVGSEPLPSLGTDLPNRIILIIGDGMGPLHIEAGAYYLGRSLSFAGFPVHTKVTTDSAGGAVTDSAAAATAIATGHKVDNGVLSLAIPGSGGTLETMLESAARTGKLTGLVTTTFLTHATPAAFGAHRSSRSDYSGVASDYLNLSRPNLLLGGGGYGLDTVGTESAGYQVVDSLVGLAAVLPSATPRLAGLFGNGNLAWEYEGGPQVAGYPDLEEMTVNSLRLLEGDGSGFFLMVEGGLIDQAAHAGNAAFLVAEVAVLDRAVASALAWAEGKSDVLIVVTADHETGGISEITDLGAGVVPAITFTTTGHTGSLVDLFAWGYGADRFLTVDDNTEIRDAIFGQ